MSFQASDTRSVNRFISSVNNIDFLSHLSSDPHSDPNINYNVFKDLLDRCISTHLPFKTVKYNKHKHKLRPWITSGIIQSIKNRDKMYYQLKQLNPNSIEYESRKRNLNTYNTILKKSIRNTKFSYFNNMFTKYKNDSKTSWKLINSLINSSKIKHNITHFFIVDGTIGFIFI